MHALVDLAKTPEQMATLAIRAHAQDQPHVLNQPMLCTEKGLIALEKHSRGHNKACHKHARERLDAIKTARRAQEQALQRLQELDETIAKTLAKHAEERADLAVGNTTVKPQAAIVNFRGESAKRHMRCDDWC